MVNIEMLEEVEKVESKIKVLFSKECRDKAMELNSVLEDMIDFYKPHLEKEINMNLICLSQEDYQQFCPIPYGMPFIFGTPNGWFISMPGENGGVVEKLTEAQIRENGLEGEMKWKGEGLNEAIREYVELIGYHEVGHIISDEMGLGLGDMSHWLYELMATYLCYTYLLEKRVDKGVIWKDICEVFLNEPGELKYSTLEEFDGNYNIIVGSQPVNYLWYQAKFNQMAMLLAKEYGVEFFFKLKAELKNNERGDATLQEVICRICPQFKEWLADF